jgi:hypothetical protein
LYKGGEFSMKRADTGAANFTTISWGDDILDLVGYEPDVYFGEIIEEAEKGTQNISPSQATALESQGRLAGEGESTPGVSKGSGINKFNQAIVVEIKKVAESQPGTSPGKIGDVFETTAGPTGEPITIRVPLSRSTPRCR